MAEELNQNLFVNSILNGMSDTLDDEQLRKLQSTLYINLHDVMLQKQTYELALTTDNDFEKLKLFAINEKIAKLSDNTIEAYLRSAKYLRAYLGKNFVDITERDVKFMIHTKKSRNEWGDITVRNQCDNLRVFFQFLVDENFMDVNPLAKIKNIKCDKVIKEAYTAMEMEAMRVICYKETRDMALIEFFNATGLRVSEVASLRWRDIDLFNRVGIVRLKGGDTDMFRFNEKCAFYLIKMLDERMTKENRTKEEMMDRPLFVCKRRNSRTKDYETLTHHDVRFLVKKIAKLANVKEAYPHKFRRTFACDAINRGMPIEDLMKLMHHKQYDTTLKYARINSTRLDNSYRTYCE